MTEIHPESGKKKLITGLVLAGIILLGLALRVSYLREIVKNPDFSLPQIDAGYYDYWARGIATGNWAVPENISNYEDPQIRTSPYFRPPGYPFFLAMIYYISNGSYLAPRIVQMMLGLVNCLMAYFLGRKLFNASVGLILAFLISTYWVFIYFEGELLAPVLLVSLGLLFFLVVSSWPDKFTFSRGFAGGIVFGLYAITLANILLFGPIVLVWSWWIAHRRNDSRKILPLWLGFILAAVIIIAPVTIRNYVVSKDFVLISSNAGINLYIGNNEFATGSYTAIPNLNELGFDDEWTSFDYPKIVAGVEKVTGRKMKYSEVSSYFTKKAIDYIWDNPGRTLKLIATKTGLFWGPAEVSNNKILSCEKEHAVTLRFLPGFPMCLSLALFGLIQFFLSGRKISKNVKVALYPDEKQFQISILIFLFILIFFLSYLPFFIAGRYRVPIIPFLFLFGSYGLFRLYMLITTRKFSLAILWIVILTGLYFAANIQTVSYESNPAKWHLLRASCYRLAKKPDMALEECREAVKLRPDLEKAQRRLADMLMYKKDYSGAIEHYTKAIQLNPRRFDVYYNLGLAYLSRGQHEQAINSFRNCLKIKPDFPEAHYSLAIELKSQGQIDAAIDHLYKALEYKDDYTSARNSLAVMLLSERRFNEAITQFRRLLEKNPNQASLHNYIGIALKSTGQINEAISHYQQAIKLKPDYYQAYNNLANALFAQDKIDEAIYYYREALKIKPDYTEAQNNLENVLKSRNSSK